MSTRVLFRCQFCDASPDDETQKSLEEQLTLLLFATFVDAEPGNWLVWHGRGMYGPTLYACADHRDTLKAYLRKHYGTLEAVTSTKGPHPVGLLRRETLEQMRRRRALMTYKRWDPRWGSDSAR